MQRVPKLPWVPQPHYVLTGSRIIFGRSAVPVDMRCNTTFDPIATQNRSGSYAGQTSDWEPISPCTDVRVPETSFRPILSKAEREARRLATLHSSLA